MNKKTPYEIKDYITDVIGLRLVCFYESDIQLIRGVLSDNFEIIGETDKTGTLEAHNDTFGYKGLHLDLRLKDNRLTLSEYSRFRDYQFEVQIRTIVQDAWSVIDHKLKYKNENIPHNLERRINRLAALFELADQEFLNIRDVVTSLEKSAPLATTIATPTTPEPLPTPETLTPFSFSRVMKGKFPTYHFDEFKIDGFVQELIEVNSSITADVVQNALDQWGGKIERYKNYQHETYFNNMNPYTIVRHALYLANKETYRGFLFELQRENFDKWLESQNAD